MVMHGEAALRSSNQRTNNLKKITTIKTLTAHAANTLTVPQAKTLTAHQTKTLTAQQEWWRPRAKR